MSSTKICSAFDIVMVLCVTSLVVAGPGELTPSETPARQQGVSVLFYVAHQGQLRDIQFNPIIFNHVLVNKGSGYKNDTGIFTVPVGGIYQFVFTAQLCRGEHNNQWYFKVNGQEKMLCHAQISRGETTLNTCYMMEELIEGDKVWVMQGMGGCAWASSTSRTITFSGILLASNGASNLGGEYVPSTSLPLPINETTSSSAGPSATLSSMTVALLLWFPLLD
ncbi:uncharacterized protein LOC128379117 [Scomber scombrus]|uniref:Uncharacterized protein LOC128379117 n=1 Tax=Scomber scombrus TaxID=13677 RepID=A0AAV1NLV9_SCOSC|nr:uncharacterized protein LOC133999799 [Scomber scombrus]